ncbi:sugar kinase [Sporosarcina highlanderae]|uniref:Sugar kinase n=1 Tax=Sporosarcina highlanderae TaxID=3035916 RepID=A0ABT8JL60_9BACL|nr:sugar kinase [Sporosarcina highlanderae]MDN4605888.1 sugar kinase [Sporosarcina highlanderae]
MDVVTFGEMMAVFNPDRIGPINSIYTFHKSVGGAEGNVAIGLSRLGNKAGFFSRVGNDPFGKNIISLLRAEGVDTSRLITDEDFPTGLYFKEKRNSNLMNIYYYRNNSAASRMNVDDLDIEYIANAKWLHITGITPLLSENCRELVLKSIEIAKESNVKISFDPNIRTKLMDDKGYAFDIFTQIASASDLIMPGISEGKFLTGEEEPEKIANKLLELGAEKVAIKLGEQGAYFKNTMEEGTVPGIEIREVIDSVGAGDAFAAGVLSGLLDNFTLKEAVIQGNQLGALAVMCEGDIEGLPTKQELEIFKHDKDDVFR